MPCRSALAARTPLRSARPGRIVRMRRARCARPAARRATGDRTASSSTSSASATSPVWIHASERRVVASVRADSSPDTHCTRACGSAPAKRSRISCALAVHRLASSAAEAPRSATTMTSAASSTLLADDPPRNRSVSSAPKSPRTLAIASSSVWARCSTASATVQPGHDGVGRRQSVSSNPSSSCASSACCSATAATMSCMVPRICPMRTSGPGRLNACIRHQMG